MYFQSGCTGETQRFYFIGQLWGKKEKRGGEKKWNPFIITLEEGDHQKYSAHDTLKSFHANGDVSFRLHFPLASFCFEAQAYEIAICFLSQIVQVSDWNDPAKSRGSTQEVQPTPARTSTKKSDFNQAHTKTLSHPIISFWGIVQHAFINGNVHLFSLPSHQGPKVGPLIWIARVCQRRWCRHIKHCHKLGGLRANHAVKHITRSTPSGPSFFSTEW